MRKLLLLIYLVIFTSNFIAQTYPSLNINLLAHLNPEKDVTGIDGRKYSGCWGWAQPNKNREYAIIDVLDKLVYNETLNINETFFKTAIHTSILNNGCYFVTLKGNNINETKKILIQN